MVVVGITGGTGYIGGRLAERLLARGLEVRLVDDGSGPVNSEVPGRPLLRADFASPKAEAWLSDCDVILHLAARSGVVICERDPEGTRRVNVGGTERLVLFCRERKIPMVFASSFSVVGVPDHLPVTESAPARPPHAYARQKAEGEELVRTLANDEGTLGAVMRMSNLYGGYLCNGSLLAKGNVINLYASEAVACHNLKVFAPGTQRRDFVYIDDVCAHWEAAVRYLRSSGRQPSVPTFNVASGETASVSEVASAMVRKWNEWNDEALHIDVELVPNPRADVEILQEEFSVESAWTRRTLGVRCGMTLALGIERVLRDSRGASV